ncbi:MAG: LamG domain-containing protein [Pseudomonadota bacterium]
MLTACGSGSGPGVQEIPPADAPDVSNYTGPAPSTADVQNFKLAVWDNLVPNNRCGSCHNQSQSPRFVRADDINMAYEVMNPLADLSDPAQSSIVAKVRSGHNCWLSDADACGDILVSYIENWAGNTLGGGSRAVPLTAPVLRDPGDSKNFPVSPGAFASTVYPVLDTYCSNCHSEAAAVPQQPLFASADVAAAYDAARTKIDLDTPSSSRFVVRLASEFHNCWSNCALDAAEMDAAITAFANGISATEIDGDLVTSKALTMLDGIIASSGGRIENNVVALYEFKTGSGNVAFDTSGVEPALNLTLSGDTTWVGGYGISMTSGKAQGSTAASAKLQQQLSATNEYSIEAWVVPGNVTQDGPARIVTYSGGTDDRNLMLGQTLYDYDLLNRSDVTGADGEPRLSTPSDEEVLQATLQHVVATFDPTNGRQIFVNGELRSGTDPAGGGLLADWNDTYALAIGSEVDNDNRWAGTMRLLAIHSRTLTPEQIMTNYDAGVGEKFFLLFNVSDHVGTPDAYIVFVVSQFDSYGYLFDAPFFTVLGDGTIADFDMRGIRIGVNGRELVTGQAYANLDESVTGAAVAASDGQLALSRLGTVVAVEKGAELDEFFLTFEQLGASTNVFIEATPPPPADPVDTERGPDIGIRDFAEIDASMSAITGIPRTNAAVRATFEAVHQAMPVNTNLEGFISSQQMAVTQLSISYCNELLEDTGARSSFFPGMDFDADVSIAFADTGALLDPLITRGIGVVSSQPDAALVRAELDALITTLTNCGGSCEADRTVRVAKAACAAVLGSAAMMLQ